MENNLEKYLKTILGVMVLESKQEKITTYHGSKKDDVIEFLWTLPPIEECKRLKRDALLLNQLDRDVLKFVLDYESGILYRLMKILTSPI